MAFRMDGSQLYGKLKLDRNMDDSSQPDGRVKSSAFQKGVSPMKDKPTKKPTKEEIFAAANDPSVKKDANYYAWKVGGKLPTTYHGAGGTIMNKDGTVNKKLTNRQLASLKR